MNQDHSMNKTCPRCNKTYMFAEKHFNKDKFKKDGLSSVCKKCRSDEYFYYKSLKPVVPKIEKVCLFKECDNTFIPTTRNDQLYCCISCRDKANKWKNGKQEYYDKKNFNRRFQKKKELEKATNKDKSWSDADIKLLIKMRFDRKTFKQISEKVGRTSTACWKKYYELTNERGLPRINLNKKEKDYNK